jgi:hypothetical protein
MDIQQMVLKLCNAGEIPAFHLSFYTIQAQPAKEMGLTSFAGRGLCRFERQTVYVKNNRIVFALGLSQCNP